MFYRNWAAWLRSRTRTRAPRSARWFRPQLEGLEHRIVPAFNTTISTSSTLGVQISGSGPVVTFESVAPGANISVSDILAQLQGITTTEVDILNGSTGTEN